MSRLLRIRSVFLHALAVILCSAFPFTAKAMPNMPNPSTNYWLQLLISGTGQVNVVDGWCGAATNVLITATTSNHNHFVSWSGNTNECAITNNAITAIMDGARSITANFGLDTQSLTVATLYGNGNPAAGTLWTNYNTSMSVAITNSPVINGNSTTQYLCTGWTGTGSTPANGTTTNTPSFLLTNNSAVTWNWTTNYWLKTGVDTNSSGGTLNIQSGWFANGSNVTVTATPSNHWALEGWQGTEGILSNNSITIPMSGPATITAFFTWGTQLLTVASAYGMSVPPAGTTSYTYNTSASVGITNATVPNGTTTQYVCTGWSGTGSITAGTGTNATFTLTNDSTIVWTWQTNFLLTATSGSNGSVNVTNSWFAQGTNVLITATPSNFYQFASWTGDTNGCTISSNTISAPMSRARAITANFSGNQYSLISTSTIGLGLPRLGTTNWYAYNSTATAAITNAPRQNAWTQYMCVGWVVTGTTTNGTGTNATFTITNNATIAWNWVTNYWLSSTAGSNGSVNVTNQWFSSNTNALITATPSNNYYFASWSGTTSGCTISTNTISVPMNVPRAITANFAINTQSLAIVTLYGNANPAAGTNWNNYNTSMTAAITNSPVTSGTTQYVCNGWTGTGGAPASGTTTNTGSFLLTNNESITWNWATNYRLTTATASSGTVDIASAWFAKGSNAAVTVTATPATHYYFSAWSGDTNGCGITNNTIAVPMTGPRAITANFAINTQSLTVATLYGNANPATGTNWNNYGVSIVATITNSPVINSNSTTQYLCTGWIGTGSVPASGATTNTPSFLLTTNSTVTWGWTTNYRLTTAVVGSGNMNMASGWYGIGTTNSITAITSNGSSFTAWSGDTNGCTISSNTIAVPISGPRTITATFNANQSLISTSTIGLGLPQLGTTNWYAYNSTATAAITNAPRQNAWTQYMCVGWVVTGTTTNGTGTNATFTITNNATIAWNWVTNYWLSSTAGSNGSVNVTNQWFSSNTNALITATPSNNYYFASWSGTTSGCTISTNTISVPMNVPRAITANFAINTQSLAIVTLYGNANPAAGTNWNNYNTSMTAAITNSPVTSGTTQYVCNGWTGTGGAPASGTTTNTGSFLLTNNESITWNWATNYRLTTATASSGTVDIASAWFAKGSNAAVTVTATPATHYYFSAWSGDTNGCGITNNTIAVPMTGPRAITANFAINTQSLTVVTLYGNANPAAGTNWNNYNTSMTAAITNSPVTSGTTQYVCNGWTGTGGAPTNGTTTNTPSFLLNNNETITWNWTTNYWLNRSVSGNGQVNGTDGWYAGGSNVQLTATSSVPYKFASWSGDTNGCTINSNTISVPMTSYRHIYANFGIDQMELVVATPFGLGTQTVGTNLYNYGAAITADITNSAVVVGSTTNWCIGWVGTGCVPATGDTTNTGPFILTANSSITWLWSATEPIGSQAPNNEGETQASQVTGIKIVASSTGGRVLTWPSSSGYFYSVLRSTDLSQPNGGFLALPDAIDIPATPPVNTYTDTDPIAGAAYYEVGMTLAGNP